MHKRSLVALFSILTIFLLSGCVQGPVEMKYQEIDTVEQEESNISKNEEKTVDSSTSKEEGENQNNDSTQEVSSLSELKINFIDVGQADSTLLQFSLKVKIL